MLNKRKGQSLRKKERLATGWAARALYHGALVSTQVLALMWQRQRAENRGRSREHCHRL